MNKRSLCCFLVLVGSKKAVKWAVQEKLVNAELVDDASQSETGDDDDNGDPIP